MATVLLVRHGETTWNREGRVQGWAGTPLTDRGHEQASAVASHLAATYDVDRLVASDLRRTTETAREAQGDVVEPGVGAMLAGRDGELGVQRPVQFVGEGTVPSRAGPLRNKRQVGCVAIEGHVI